MQTNSHHDTKFNIGDLIVHEKIERHFDLWSNKFVKEKKNYRFGTIVDVIYTSHTGERKSSEIVHKKGWQKRGGLLTDVQIHWVEQDTGEQYTEYRGVKNILKLLEEPAFWRDNRENDFLAIDFVSTWKLHSV